MKLGLAVAGVGYWGHHYVRLAQQNKNAELKVVCDLKQDTLELLNEQYPHLRTTTNISEVINNKNIDAVIVSTPVKTHYQIVKSLLLAGKNVLCEKVLTYSSKDAEDLIRIAKESNVKLAVCHTFEYNSCVKYIKKVLEEKLLGDIMYFHFKRTGTSPIRQDVNSMWDLSAHDVSILINLLDELPLSVSAFGKSYMQDGLEDVVFMNLEFSDGVIANIHCSWLDPIRQRSVTVVGKEKILVFNDASDKDKVFIHNFEGNYTPTINYKEPLKEQVSDFIDSIISNRQPQVNGESGLRVVRVLEAAQRSLENNSEKIIL